MEEIVKSFYNYKLCQSIRITCYSSYLIHISIKILEDFLNSKNKLNYKSDNYFLKSIHCYSTECR